MAAGRLRQKLAVYYGDEGADSYVRIALPVGTYIPTFARQEDSQALGGYASVAVLPFADPGVAAGIEHIGDEIAGELFDKLACVGGLKVVGRTSAMRFRSDNSELRAIGRALGVGAVLQGRVERGDGRIRLTVRLETTRDTGILWSGEFAYRADDAFHIQHHLVDAVVRALRSAHKGAPQVARRANGFPLVRRETANAEAKDLSDRGRFALRQQGIGGLRKAAELFGRATQIDGDFAAAYSGLALAQLGLVGMTAVPSLPDIRAAKSAVHRALQIDPQLSEAYSSLASITFRYEFNWAGAEPLYRQAIRLAPGARYAHHSYAFALTMNGRFAEADAEYHIARDVDPLDQNLRCQHALMPIYTGQYGAAEADLLAILDVDQDNLLARTLLGATCLHTGNAERALAAYQWAIDAAPDLSIGLCGRAQALALLGRMEEAEALLHDMVARNDGQFVSAYQVAMVHTRLGNDALALEWLDRAGTQRDANFVCAPVDPTFERLRASKSWAMMLHRHGLRTSR